MSVRSSTTLVAVAPFLLAGALIAATSSVPGTYFTVDIGVKMLQVRACLEHGCVVPYPAGADDPDHRYRPIQPPFAEQVSAESYAGVYRNLTIAAAVHLVGALGEGAELLLSLLSLAALMAAGVVLGWRLGIPPPWSLAATGVLGPAWFYASVFWEHLPATALTTWAVVLLLGVADVRGRGAAAARAAVAGVLAALAVSLRPEAAVALATMGGALLAGGWPRRLAVAGAAAVCLAGLGLLHAIEPSLLPFSQVHHNVTGHGFDLGWWLMQRLENGVLAFGGIGEFLPLSGFIEYRESAAFWPCLVLVLVWLGLLGGGSRLSPAGTTGKALRSAGLVLAALIPLSRLHEGVPQTAGLLIASPLLLMAMGRPKDADGRVLWHGSMAFLGLALLTMPNGGGSQIGPRYLLPVVPLLTLLAVRDLRAMLLSAPSSEPASPPRRPRWPRLLAVGALAATVLSQGVGFAHVVSGDSDKDKTLALLRSLDADAYLSPNGFVPCDFTALIPGRPFFFLPDPRHPEPLAKLLQARGARRIVVLSNLPRARPTGPVFFGPYTLRRIIPVSYFSDRRRAAWEFVLPG